MNVQRPLAPGRVVVRKRRRRRVLFVHNNFPAQFGFVAGMLAAEGCECASISSPQGKELDGVRARQWRLSRGTSETTYPPALRAEADMLRGRAALDCALALKKEGFTPDLIIGHPGWGETVFLKEAFPAARQIAYGEYYYRAHGSDVDFDLEFGRPGLDERVRVMAKNATMAMAYADADRIICPTPYQASLLPAIFQQKATIVHEGVDTAIVQRRRDPRLTLDGCELGSDGPVITFVNRVFEPLRGYHLLLRALPRVLAAVPAARVVLVGEAAEQGYGARSPDGVTWKDHFLNDAAASLDLQRVHFAGRLPYAALLDLLSLSTAHVYYTYPFVLSWSLLEAMAAECLVVASDTAPVRDAITHGENGLLLNFFDVEGLADALIAACREPQRFAHLRGAARATIVERFNRRAQGERGWWSAIAETMDWPPERTRPSLRAEQAV